MAKFHNIYKAYIDDQAITLLYFLQKVQKLTIQYIANT